MSRRPYESASAEWVREHADIFKHILRVAGQHKFDLEKLRDTGDVLKFAGVTEDELKTALAVCDKLMAGIGPTAQAMRDELDMREGDRDPAVRAGAPKVVQKPKTSRLPILH